MLQRSGVDLLVDVLVRVLDEYVDADVVLDATLGFCCLPECQRPQLARPIFSE